MLNLENLYISPLELCNLSCKYCYTTKTKNILSNQQILDFVSRYSATNPLKSIIFCGGEVFTLPDFPTLVNQLISQNIFITIITNGTIDRLSEITDPSNCQLLVSFDGPESIHDHNRGQGNFQKSLTFVKKALKLGFPVEIMFLVTQDSYPYKDSFDILGLPKSYLTDRLHSLTPDQILNIKEHYPTFPAKNFGCSTLSLQSNGRIYGCCESSLSIGQISEPIDRIISNYKNLFSICHKCQTFADEQFLSAQRTSAVADPKVASTAKICSAANSKCHGCCHPTYLCDYIKDLHCTDCQEVIQLIHS